jgi:hypothetical protein
MVFQYNSWQVISTSLDFGNVKDSGKCESRNYDVFQLSFKCEAVYSVAYLPSSINLLLY